MNFLKLSCFLFPAIIYSNYAKLVQSLFLFSLLLAISCHRHPWETEQDLLRETQEFFFSTEITTQEKSNRLHTAENVSVDPPEKNRKPHGSDEQVSGKKFRGLV